MQNTIAQHQQRRQKKVTWNHQFHWARGSSQIRQQSGDRRTRRASEPTFLCSVYVKKTSCFGQIQQSNRIHMQCSNEIYFTLLYLYANVVSSTLPLRESTLLCSPLYFTLLYSTTTSTSTSTLLCSTLPRPLALLQLYSTRLCSTLPLHRLLPLLCSTSTSTSALFCSTLFYSTLFFSTIPLCYSTLLKSTSPLLDSTLLERYSSRV